MDSSWPMTGHDVHHTYRSPYGSPGNYIVEKWKILLDKPAHYYHSPVIAEDGTIYVVSGISCDTLYAINPNGTIKWKYVTAVQLDETLYTPAIDKDGTIYVKSDEEEFYAFNPNGTIKWISYLKDTGRSSPTINDNGTIFVSGGNIMYAMNPNGTIKWQFISDSEIRTSPAIDNNGDVYFVSYGGYLYALYPDNGTVKWQRVINSDQNCWINPVIGDDGNIYIVGGYNLYGIYPNGTRIWKVLGGGYFGLSIDYEGTLYTGSGNLRAYSSDGQLKWEIESIGYRQNIVTDKNGMLYMISDSSEGYQIGRLMQISSDGKILASIKPSADFEYISFSIRSDPVIADDGTLYVTTKYNILEPPYSKGYLHAFEVLNVENEPPEKPVIKGPTSGKTGIEYTFSAVSTDPDGNNVSYYFQGIGNFEWSDFTPSGTPINISYAWDEPGEFCICVQTMDIYGGMSDWITHKINIKLKNKEFSSSLLLRFLERYPLLKRLLNIVLC